MAEIKLKFEHDKALLADILSALPKRMESSLNLHKNRLLGSLPKNREDFNPFQLLSKLSGGEKVIVLDSSKDLPPNWRNINMVERFGPSQVDDLGLDDAGSGVSTAEEGATTDEDNNCEDAHNSDEGYEDATLNDKNC